MEQLITCNTFNELKALMSLQITINGVVVFVVKAEVVGQFPSYDGLLYVWLDRFLVLTAILADRQDAPLNRDLTYKENNIDLLPWKSSI